MWHQMWCFLTNKTLFSSQKTFRIASNLGQCWQEIELYPCYTWSSLGWWGPSSQGLRCLHRSTMSPSYPALSREAVSLLVSLFQSFPLEDDLQIVVFKFLTITTCLPSITLSATGNISRLPSQVTQEFCPSPTKSITLAGVVLWCLVTLTHWQPPHVATAHYPASYIHWAARWAGSGEQWAHQLPASDL